MSSLTWRKKTEERNNVNDYVQWDFTNAINEIIFDDTIEDTEASNNETDSRESISPKIVSSALIGGCVSVDDVFY